MNLCQNLWESYDALKQAYSDAQGLLNEGKNHSNSDFQEAIDKLSIAKQAYDETLYTDLPDGRKIYALDYLSLIKIAVENKIEVSKILDWKNKNLLDNNHRIISLKLNELLLTTLDLSCLSALAELDCSDNLLKSLDVTNNPALTKLTCTNNQITSLDVSKNSILERLECNINKLHSLDLTHNNALVWIYCNSNQLTLIQVPESTALKWLECSHNQLTSLLSIKSLPDATYVYASYNQPDLESIELAKQRGWNI